MFFWGGLIDQSYGALRYRVFRVSILMSFYYLKASMRKGGFLCCSQFSVPKGEGSESRMRLSPKLQTPKQQAPNPKPETLNPKPQTLNPKPPNPKPQNPRKWPHALLQSHGPGLKPYTPKPPNPNPQTLNPKPPNPSP